MPLNLFQDLQVLLLFSGPPEKLQDHQILWAGGPVDHSS